MSKKPDWPPPAAFDPASETVKLLAQAKAKVSKSFGWTKAQSLYDAGALAVLLHVFRRDEEAIDICRGLGRIQFDGKYSLWSAVETALTLQARLLRHRGEAAEADECVRRVREAGFVDERLDGILLDRNGSVAEAVRTADRKWEQGARLVMAKEIGFIIELGGSDKCPVAEMERQWGENLARLRELTGAGA